MNTLADDQSVRALLDRLHAASDAEDGQLRAHLASADFPTGYEPADSASRAFWRDKYVAIDRDKAEFVYALCRAMGARHILEAGTAFGVSTLYLAAALRDNGGGRVTTCDFEESKAAVARSHFTEAGLADLVEVRVGDIRSEFRHIDGPVDLLLLDIWAPVAADVVALVGPRLRTGGVVIADNTNRRDRYAGLLAILEDPANGFTTQTLPFPGGLELAVKTS
jgi:predicted O-methyltransferase YrrM